MLREIEELRRKQDSLSRWQQDVARGGSKRAKAGEIVNRSIILNPFLLQDTNQRPIDLGISSSYLRDELEGLRGACCRTSSLPPIAFFRSGFALHPADCSRLAQLLADVGLALVLRALDLFHAPGDHIEEESEIDDATCALHALRTSIQDFVEEAAQSVVVSWGASVLLLGVGIPCGFGFSPAGPLGLFRARRSGRHRSGAGTRSEQPGGSFHNFAVKSRLLQPSRDLLEAIRVLAPRNSDIALGTQPTPHSARRCRN